MSTATADAADQKISIRDGIQSLSQGNLVHGTVASTPSPKANAPKPVAKQKQEVRGVNNETRGTRNDHFLDKDGMKYLYRAVQTPERVTNALYPNGYRP